MIHYLLILRARIYAERAIIETPCDFKFMHSRAGMSNSNHCAGRTLSFKARKAYSGPQFEKTCYSVSILDIFHLKMDKN
jgi:hypothetical protein